MATEKRCYYEVLGVERTDSEAVVARAYRKLAIRYHPDSNTNDAEATLKFKEAAEAYEVLSDPEKRARYDRYGHAGVSGGGGGGFRDVEDIFDAFGDIFGFGDMFGGGRRRARRGADVKAEVTLDLEEAAAGVKKEIRFRRHKACPTCQGSGAKPGSSPATCRQCGGHGQVVQSAGILRVQTSCPVCKGTGRIVTEGCADCRGHGQIADNVTLEVQIPAGVDDGMQVRLHGEGEAAPPGGQAGDCYCVIRIRPHKIFEREGSHLFIQMPISYTQATLGATVEVPSLEGKEALKIPAGTESGHVFQLRRKGMPDPRNGARGDLLVRTFVEVPKSLNAEEEALLRQLAELEHANVAPHRKSVLENIRDYFSANLKKAAD